MGDSGDPPADAEGEYATCHECGARIPVGADETSMDAVVAHFEAEHEETR